MNPIEQIIDRFHDLMAQVPDVLQPVLVFLAGAIPFVEGEGAAFIGVVGGLNPVVTAMAAAGGNFVCVLIIVMISSRARATVVNHRSSKAMASAGTRGEILTAEQPEPHATRAKPESKGRRRFQMWLVRFGVPGASILGPLAVPTQITSAMLVASGVSARWVLLWQAVAIVFWTALTTSLVWIATTLVVGG